MIGRSGRTDHRDWRRAVVVGLAACCAIVVFQVGLSRFVGHAPTLDEMTFYGWAAMLIAAAVYVLATWTLGGRAVDQFVTRVIDGVFGSRHG
jgi:hypothetical protein